MDIVSGKKIIENGEEKIETHNFFHRTKLVVVLTKESIPESVDELTKNIEEKYEYGFQKSGCIILNIEKFFITVTRFRPLSGSNYIPTPKFIYNKKCALNIQNNDERCFLWSILAHLYPARTNRTNIYSYRRHADKIKISKFPVAISDIPKIEKDNNIAINVYKCPTTIESLDEIHPIYYSKQMPSIKRINLLYIYEPREGDFTPQTGHYILITKFHTLYSTITKYNGKKKYFCDLCNQHFTNERILNDHRENCINTTTPAYQECYPTGKENPKTKRRDNILRFWKYGNMEKTHLSFMLILNAFL